MSSSPPAQSKGGGRRLRAIAGRNVAFDDEGFFQRFEEWSEEIFEVLAGESGIAEITDRHRKVVRFLREFYAYNGRAPLNNELRKGISMSLLELDGLFPEGLRQGGQAAGRAAQSQNLQLKKLKAESSKQRITLKTPSATLI